MAGGAPSISGTAATRSGSGGGGEIAGGQGTGIGGASGGTVTTDPPASLAAVGISVGASAACALRNDGRVLCWLFAPNPVPAEVPGVENARAVSVGDQSNRIEQPVACAVLMDGTVRCWGYASIQRPNQNTPLAMSTIVPGLTDAVTVSAGEGYTCVILGDQTAKCWGENTWETLGNGQSYAALPNSSRPVEVVGLRGASSISAGRELTCAAMFDGTARCWGFLPLAGSYDSYTAPIDIGLNGIADISAGTNHACARFSDGTVRCFGDVTYGSGYNRGYSPTIPTNAVLEPGSRPAVEVSAGTGHDCALGFDGSITCWGATESLGLGVDVTEEGVIRYRSGPGPVVGIANAKAMDAGNGVTCAIAADGSVWCWGFGLGHGANSGLPQRIVGL